MAIFNKLYRFANKKSNILAGFVILLFLVSLGKRQSNFVTAEFKCFGNLL